MKDAHEYELIISQGDRPLWKTIMAAVCFTLLIYLLYTMALPFFYSEATENLFRSVAHNLGVVGCLLAAGVKYSMTKTVLIDTDKDKLISKYHVGPLTFSSQSSVPDLEYVSVFKDGKDMFQANLWYKGNKHYKMFVFEEKEPAFRFAEMVSDRLAIDLLDATERGNSKWIERTNTE